MRSKQRALQNVLNKLKCKQGTGCYLKMDNVNVEISARNIADVKTAKTNTINVFDVLKYNTVVATKAAVAGN